MSGSVASTAYSLYKTAAITLPTFAEALVARLDPARVDARLARWGRALVRQAGVELTVTGLQELPHRGACVFMSNHQSFFDIPILYSLIPGRLRMVAKAELFRVPIWGQSMRQAGFVPVTRSGDRQDAKLAMSACAQALASGVSIWIAPEGTRSSDGRLGTFKRGGFWLAQKSGAVIVPVAIDGSRRILPKHGALVNRGVPVCVAFGPPIATAGREIAALSTEVRAFLTAHLHPPAGA